MAFSQQNHSSHELSAPAPQQQQVPEIHQEILHSESRIFTQVPSFQKDCFVFFLYLLMYLFILYSIKNFIPILSYTSLANVNTENKDYKHSNVTARLCSSEKLIQSIRSCISISQLSRKGLISSSILEVKQKEKEIFSLERTRIILSNCLFL